jgi:predicted Zn finger-like uncharacterized protein
MNVTCTGCPAKYSVPDDKVRGKKVRITCKHCGTNIVVDGSALGASQSALPEVDKPAAAPAVLATPSASAKAAPAPAAAAPVVTKAVATESTWLVGFIDERQEQHPTSGVVDLYANGKIDDETLVWKDGMDNWLPPFDVPEIAAVLKQRDVARRAPSFALPGSSDDAPTVVGRSPFEEETVVSSIAPLQPEKPAPANSPAAPAVAATLQSTPEIKPSAAAIRQSTPEIKPAAATIRQSAPEIKPAAVPAAAKPSAARRAEKRAEVDLFGGVANAGSEADTSLDFGAADEPAHKMMGARNESSVLFSLDALTKPDPKAGQKKALDREKEKQATADLFGDEAPNSLMNMGGGGLAALAAPDFTKPAAPEPAPVRPSDPVEVPNAAPAKKGSALLIAAIVGIAAAAGLAFMFMSRKPPPDKPADSASTDTKAAAAPSTPVATATETATASAPETASAEPATSAAAPAASGSATATASKPIAPGAAPAVASATAGAAATVNKPAEKPADAKKPDSAPAVPAAGADFDRSAAIAALGAAAANAVSCKKPDGPTGGGKVSVTFAPSGRATNSTVTGAFAGTDVGGCVARIFRSARVPAFAGDAVTVSKSFSIE